MITPRRYSQIASHPISITWLLGAVLPKPELERWKRQQVLELARKHTDIDDPDELLQRHGPRGDVRGTEVHRAIAARLSGQPMPSLSDAAAAYYEQWEQTWDAMHVTTEEQIPIYTEHVVYHRKMNLAGTADAIKWDADHHLAVIYDWKTTHNLPDAPWIEHEAQIAFYARAWQLSLSYPCDIVGAIMYISERGTALHVVDIERGSDLVDAAYGLASMLWPSLIGESNADQ